MTVEREAIGSAILGLVLIALQVLGCAAAGTARSTAVVTPPATSAGADDAEVERLLAAARQAEDRGDAGATAAWERAGRALVERGVTVEIDAAPLDVDEWLAWSPDGRSIAARFGDEIVVMGAARLDARFSAAGGGAAFAGPGRLLARSDDRRLRLWEIGSGKLLRTIEEPSDYQLGEAHAGRGGGVGFPDYARAKVLSAVSTDDAGRWAITAEGSNAVVWSLANGSQHATHELPGVVLAVAMNRDGRWCAAAGGKEVHLFDTSKGRRTHRVELADHPRVLAVSQDGAKIAALSTDALDLIDVGSPTARRFRVRPDALAVAFAGPPTLVVPTAEGLTLWDATKDVGASTLPPRARSLLAHPSEPIVLGSGGGTQFRLDHARLETVRRISSPSAVWLGEGSLGFGTFDGSAGILRPDGSASFGRALAKSIDVISGNPDGTWWAVGDESGTVAVLGPGGKPRELVRLKQSVTALAFADRSKLWAGSYGELVAVDVNTGAVASRAEHDVIVGGLARTASHAIVRTRAVDSPIGGGEVALLQVATGRVIARAGYPAGHPRASVTHAGDALLFAGETRPTWWPKQGDPKPLWAAEEDSFDAWWDMLWLSSAGIGIAGRDLLAVADPRDESVVRDLLEPTRGAVWAASGDDEGKRVALATNDGVVVVDLAKGRRVARVISGEHALAVIDARGRVQLSDPGARALLQCRAGGRWFPYALCAAGRESSSVWRDALAEAR